MFVFNLKEIGFCQFRIKTVLETNLKTNKEETIMKKCFLIAAFSVMALFFAGTVQATTWFDFSDAGQVAQWQVNNVWSSVSPILSYGTYFGGSLKVDVPSSGYTTSQVMIEGAIGTGNLSSEPIYSVDIFIPSTAYGYSTEFLAMKDSGGDYDMLFQYDYPELPQGTMSTLTWDASIDYASRLSQINKLGIGLDVYGPCTYYINNVRTSAAGDSQPIPEPASLLLVGSGLAGLFGFGKRKKLIA